jgi:hypothetical protein
MPALPIGQQCTTVPPCLKPWLTITGIIAPLRLLFARQAKGKRKLVLWRFFTTNRKGAVRSWANFRLADQGLTRLTGRNPAIPREFCQTLVSAHMVANSRRLRHQRR